MSKFFLVFEDVKRDELKSKSFLCKTVRRTEGMNDSCTDP